MADDSLWSAIKPITGFRQYLPVFARQASFTTEVKIAYDDYAIYVLAMMHDPSPDSILRQLGIRDDDDLNADMFSIEFDTYNNQLDAYSFQVTASGVQIDWRESDETYDAVWESKVKITNEGWVAELKIPYSALRFAPADHQKWGMQISRSVRRYRETDQWSLEIPEATQKLPYWGTLDGIDDIEPPVRLSATPYILLQAEHYPDEFSSKDISTSFGGGMDLKYGFNESFTLDVSLLPDFSQVQSDNKVKNLSAFETIFEEQRPFFKEAVDLFKKGDLFYSRRIGKTPAYFYTITDSLAEGEYIRKNPVQQRILNATKLSGRNKNGTAIGFLNTITANTHAIAENRQGNKRKILTDPLTNYNLLVFDQAMKNNSDFYITNTSVLRGSQFRNANVTASGLMLNNRSNKYQVNLTAAMSQIFTPDTSGKKAASRGFKYGISLVKTKGNFQWSAGRFTMDDSFDANDLGLTWYNNYNSNEVTFKYNIYKPFWVLRDMHNTLTISNQNNFTTHKPQTALIEYSLFETTLKYLTLWAGIAYNFLETYDYYEPRTPGMYYILPKSTSWNMGFSSDYRKTFALDGGINGYYAERNKSKGYSFILSPIWRLNNHLKFYFVFSYAKNLNDYGYVASKDNLVLFGKREINTFENSVNAKYLFKNNLSLNLLARHYYKQGKYDSFYTLLGDGNLQTNMDYGENQDFIFISLNIDMVLSWVFAPGSSLNLVWKNEIISDRNNAGGTYLSNFDDTFLEPQLNNISVKVLYYIDYQNFKR